MAPKLKLTYWPAAGRAEITRLMLTLGGVEFEDVRIKGEDWPTLKPQTPFGQVPVLEVDGQQLTQSHAIELYASKVSGFEPSDPFVAAKSFSYVYLLEDMWQHLYATFRLPDDEKIKKRQELLAGPVHDLLTRLEEHLGALKDGEYLVGTPEPTIGDLAVFVGLSQITSGTMDGIPTDLLEKYPNSKAFRKKVASLPKVKVYYEGRADQLNVASYKAFTPDYPN